MSELFNVRDIGYALRGAYVNLDPILLKPSIMVSHLATKMWALAPEEIKNSCSLNTFKHKIKIWVHNFFPYRI